jgi:cytochrome c oxidase assembly protein subunit 15
MSGRLERLRERTNGYTLTPEQYLRVAWVALGALTLIVLSGAAVRLTGSGLGCPTWPKCYGNVYPPLKTHALIEFSNRLITFPVSIAAGLAWLGALRRRPYRRDLMWLGALLPLGVVAQAVLGGFTVKGQLDYGWVMGHFSLSMLILVAAVVLVWRAGRSPIGHEPEPEQDEPGEQLVRGGAPAGAAYDPRRSGAETGATGLLDRRLVLAVRTLVGLASLTIVAGTAATAAGPHAGGSPGQKINRMDFDGRGTMDFVIHRHAEIAFVFSLAAVAVWFIARRWKAGPRIERPLTVLCVLLALQGAVGLDQYETHLPTELVWIHVGLASLTWLSVLWAACAAGRLAPREEPATEHRVAPPARVSA